MYRLALVALILMASACSTIPEQIRHAPNPDIHLPEVQHDFSAHRGKTVRWGGTVLSVINDESYTTIQILHYPLQSNGRPEMDGPSKGRFILKNKKFLDPAVYTKGRELTVTGTLRELSAHKVGRKTLELPVIESRQIHLWPQQYEYRHYGYCGYSPLYGGYHYAGCYRPPAWRYYRYRHGH